LAVFAAEPIAFAQENPRKPADLEIQVHLLIASSDPASAGKPPASLAPLTKQLQNAVQFQHFRLGATFFHRAAEGAKIEASGVMPPLLPVATSLNAPTFFTLRMEHVLLADSPAGGAKAQLRNFQFGFRLPILVASLAEDSRPPAVQYENVGYGTSSVQIPLGAVTVVGTINTGRANELFVIVAEVRKVE
jgi:hypothetical protein